MGLVIDLLTYRICGDLSLSIIGKPTETVKEDFSTKHLYALSLHAKNIIFYPTSEGSWVPIAPAAMAKALSTGFYRVDQPGFNHLRLTILDNSISYIDLYFKKPFSASEELKNRLVAFMAETYLRGSSVCQHLSRSKGLILKPLPPKPINWDELHQNPFADFDEPFE